MTQRISIEKLNRKQALLILIAKFYILGYWCAVGSSTVSLLLTTVLVLRLVSFDDFNWSHQQPRM